MVGDCERWGRTREDQSARVGEADVELVSEHRRLAAPLLASRTQPCQRHGHTERLL